VVKVGTPELNSMLPFQFSVTADHDEIDRPAGAAGQAELKSAISGGDRRGAREIRACRPWPLPP